MARYVRVKFKGKVILTKVKYCDTFFSRMLGLMFSSKLGHGEGAILVADRESKEATSIHMFFVFFPLDVFWLDKGMRVVDVKRNIRPFVPLIVPNEKAKFVLETPVGSITGDVLGRTLEIR